MGHPNNHTLQELSKLLRHMRRWDMPWLWKKSKYIALHHGSMVSKLGQYPRIPDINSQSWLDFIGPSMEYSPFWKNFTKYLSVFFETSSSMASGSPSSWFSSAPSRDAMKVAGMPTFLQLLGKCSPWGISPQGNDRVTRHGGKLSLRMSTNSHKMRSWGEQYVRRDHACRHVPPQTTELYQGPMILSSLVISSLNHASPWASLPISVAMTTGISCGVRKSNKAPVATAYESLRSVEHVTYSHHTQKCFAANWTLLKYFSSASLKFKLETGAAGCQFKFQTKGHIHIVDL